jgi:hypothetical protein
MPVQLDGRDVGTVSDKEIAERFAAAIKVAHDKESEQIPTILALLNTAEGTHPFTGWAHRRCVAIRIINLVEGSPV